MLVEARNQPGQRRLAAARTPDQSNHLPRLDDKADVVEHLFVGVRVLEAQIAHFQTTFKTIALDRALIHFRRLIQLLENTLGTSHAFLDGRADFGELANRLGQQTGHGDVGHQIARRCVTAKIKHEEHDHGHGAVRHQLQHRCVDRAGLGHGQLLVGVALAGVAKTVFFIDFATETAHDAITMNGLGGDVRDVAHGHLDLFALLAEFLAGAVHHNADHRQDSDHHQGEFPVHPQQGAEQENHGHAFTDDHFDRIRRRPRDHRHVEGDSGNQMTGVVLVEEAVG